jgi:hypothetical protein
MPSHRPIAFVPLVSFVGIGSIAGRIRSMNSYDDR